MQLERKRYGGEIRELIREYQDGKISRRDFMRKAITLTGVWLQLTA